MKKIVFRKIDKKEFFLWVGIIIFILGWNSNSGKIQMIRSDLKNGFAERAVERCFRLLRREHVKNKYISSALVGVLQELTSYIEKNNIDVNRQSWRRIMAMNQFGECHKNVADFLTAGIKANRVFQAVDLLEDKDFFDVGLMDNRHVKVYALALWQKRRVAPALSLFKKYLHSQPDDFNAAYQYMLMSFIADKFEDASSLASQLVGQIPKRQALEEQVSYGWIYYVLAQKKELDGKVREAVPLYAEAIKIDPWHVASYQGLIRCYQHLGLDEEFREAKKKLASLKPRFWASGDLAQKRGIFGFSFDELDLEKGGSTFVALFADPAVFPHTEPKYLLLFNNVLNPRFLPIPGEAGLPFGYASIDEGYEPSYHVMLKEEGFNVFEAVFKKERADFFIQAEIFFPEDEESVASPPKRPRNFLFGGRIWSEANMPLMKLFFRQSQYYTILSFGALNSISGNHEFSIRGSEKDIYVVTTNPNNEVNGSLFLQESAPSLRTGYRHIVLMELPKDVF